MGPTFGAQPGTQSERIALALTNEYQTAKELALAADVTPARVRNHLKHLIEKGVIEAEGHKYRIKQSDPTASPKMAPVASDAKPAPAAKRAKSRPPAATTGPAKASRAISTRMPAIRVEYDGRFGHRKAKHFANPHEARHFYATKLLAQKNPTVRKAE